MERVSRQDGANFATTLGTAVTVPGVATVTPGSMNGIGVGTQMLVGLPGSQEIVITTGVTATTFTAVFALTHLSTDPVVSDSNSTYRLWDVSVTDLDHLDPNWQTASGKPRMYYEDQLNVGQYGVYPLPQVGFVNNIWYSQRPPLTLTLLSSVFVPDPLAYIPYYGMLARIFRKDGEMRDPGREQYCQKRYDTGVEIVTRFLEGLGAATMPGPVQA